MTVQRPLIAEALCPPGDARQIAWAMRKSYYFEGSERRRKRRVENYAIAIERNAKEQRRAAQDGAARHPPAASEDEGSAPLTWPRADGSGLMIAALLKRITKDRTNDPERTERCPDRPSPWPCSPSWPCAMPHPDQRSSHRCPPGELGQGLRTPSGRCSWDSSPAPINEEGGACLAPRTTLQATVRIAQGCRSPGRPAGGTAGRVPDVGTGAGPGAAGARAAARRGGAKRPRRRARLIFSVAEDRRMRLTGRALAMMRQFVQSAPDAPLGGAFCSATSPSETTCWSSTR